MLQCATQLCTTTKTTLERIASELMTPMCFQIRDGYKAGSCLLHPLLVFQTLIFIPFVNFQCYCSLILQPNH